VISVPDADLRALATGETIVAFVPRATVGPGDEVELAAGGRRRPEELKEAYRRWAEAGPPEGTWTAQVEAVHPAAALDPEAGRPRHILDDSALPEGDLLVLRVSGPEGPVLSDAAFAARLGSLEAALG
jgi:hypothetical protein